MNGNKALFDSNVIIYLAKRQIPFSFLDQFDEHFISIITYMEVLGYRFRDTKEEEFIREMLEMFPIIYIDNNIADMAITLRKESSIKLPDAIIAATALVHNFHLATRNIDDFKKIDIRIINPFS